MLQAKAKLLAEALEIVNFGGSNGWLECFRKRYCIDFKILSGSSACADRLLAENWKKKYWWPN